nr:icell1 [Hydra vulgaris]
MYTESSDSDQYYKLLLYREKLMFKLNEINYDTSIFRFSFSSYKTNLTAEQIKYYMATYEFVLKLREWHHREIKHVNEKLRRLYLCNNGNSVSFFNQVFDKIKIKTKKENHYTSILSTNASVSPIFATMPKNSYIMATKPKYSVKQRSSYRLCHLPNLKPILNNGKTAEYSCPKSKCFEFYEYEKKETSKKCLSLCKKRWSSYKKKDKAILNPKISTRCSDFAKVKNENLINETCSALIASNSLQNAKSPAVNESLSGKDIELSFNNNALDNGSFYNSFSGDESIGELVIDENY